VITHSPGLRIAQWNAFSLTDKHAFVSQSILDNQLDVLAVTESWHHSSDDTSILRATPPGYSSRDCPRPPHPNGEPARGGGVVIFFRSSLRLTQVSLDISPTTFEAFCQSIATPRGSVTLLTVYRPGSSDPNDVFFEEFSSVLESLITRNSQLIILGDFNVHLEDLSSSHTKRYLNILSQFGLRQHVSEATHRSGGILDHVITSDEEEVAELHVSPPTISDHAFIKFILPSVHHQPIHIIRTLRGWKSFDAEAFGNALRSSKLFSPTETLDALTVPQLFDLYTSTTTLLLDTMLPRKCVKTRIRPLAVWFDGECHQLRRRVRCAERRYRRTKDPDDRLTWITQLRALHRLYHHKEASYWEQLVLRNAKNPKRLWSSISSLLGRPTRPLETPAFSANDFLDMLTAKTERLRSSTADAPPPTFSTTTTVFEDFRPILDSELRSVLSNVNLRSCELDPIPPFIITDILDDIAPFLLYLFNRSLIEGCIPASQKRALVFPTLKKTDLDPNLCQNYRPISNLSFLSKTLERLVSLQLLPYLEQSGLLPTYQSGYRTNHSTETALLSLLSDIYTAIDKSQVTLLALFDISAAFDMVDHDILLTRLETACGLKGAPLLWLRSYLSDRTQQIISGNSRSHWVPVIFGVPQGSVLGPLLFILYTADIPSLFPIHSATGHLFADDTQAYVHGPPSAQLQLAGCIDALTRDLDLWMSSNRLSLNSSKTQLIWLGTPQQLQKLDYSLLSDKFPSFVFSSSVRDLGVILDSTLSFTEHISKLTRISYFHLRRLRAIRKSVPSSTFATIVHAFVCSRIDYCNSLLIGLPKARLSALQSVLNAAARLIARLPRFSHITAYMVEQLHWLPLSARIQFKIIALVLKSKLGFAPKYLRDLIRNPLSSTSLRSLRSADRFDLFVPRVRTTLAQCRSFACVGPSLWNSLPPILRSAFLSGSLSSSFCRLKTHLFP